MLTFSYFTVGFPFNPTSPDYKLSISPTYKKTTVIKRLMVANIHKMNPVDIVRKALVFERDAQGYACEEKVNFWGSELRVDQFFQLLVQLARPHGSKPRASDRLGLRGGADARRR